jgi:acyl-ACP thioesterase
MSLGESFQYSLPFRVGSFQVLPDGNISLTSLADFLQEIAWRHADSADFGRNLGELNLMWVLSRLDIRMQKSPKWGEEIHAFTAGRGADKLFAFREFLILDANQEVLVSAMSSWLLLNTETKRPQRVETALPTHLFDPNQKPDWQPEKIKIEGREIYSELLKVRYSDLDLNNHVNNTSFVLWVENVLRENNFEATQLLINYQAECVKGDEVKLSLWQTESGRIVQGTVDEKVVLLASAK